MVLAEYRCRYDWRESRQRYTRRRLLPHAFCLTTGRTDSVDAARIPDRLSPQVHEARATPRARAAIVALRTCADSVRPPASLRNTVDYFRTGVKDALTLLVNSKTPGWPPCIRQWKGRETVAIV